MRTLFFLSLTLTVALGIPLSTESDRLPAHGHVVQEDPKPQVPAEVAPLVQEIPAEVVPVVEEELAVVPVVEEELAVVPVVEQEIAKVSGVEEKRPEEVPEMEKQADVVEPKMGEWLDVGMDSEAERQTELAIDPEMGVLPEQGEIARKDVEPDMKEGLIADVGLNPGADVETVKLSDPEMGLGGEEVVFVKLDDGEGSVTEGEYLLSEDPDMEMEPLHVESLMGQYVMAEETMKDLEPEMGEGQTGDYPIRVDDGIMEEEQEKRSIQQGEHVLFEEPIMELEPEEEPFGYQPIMPEDMMKGSVVEGQYFLHEEPIMELEPEIQRDHYPIIGLNSVMGEEPVMELEPLEGDGFLSKEHGESGAPGVGRPLFFEGSVMTDGSMLDGRAYMEPQSERVALLEGEHGSPAQIQDDYTGRYSCQGVVLEGKCYQFFRGPQKAPDAEFYCQEHFPQGHLASITSQQIHRQVMELMLMQNGGYTRTWVGGLRYLETGRFIWLDGSHWTYDDYLEGEPNNTADVEDCIELLAYGEGKFNDMPCWDLRAFICSYPV